MLQALYTEDIDVNMQTIKTQAAKSDKCHDDLYIIALKHTNKFLYIQPTGVYTRVSGISRPEGIL